METIKHNVVGQSVVRLDGLEKVTGTIKYTGDYAAAGMLYARLVTSDQANAKILSIDTAEALKVPGIVKIYTAAEVPETLYSAHNWLMDMSDLEDEPLLTMEPKHDGDRVAIIVAETDEAAITAARRVRIDYEPRQAVAGIDAALVGNSPAVHPYGNVPFDTVKEFGSFEEIVSKAKYIIDDTVTTPSQHHAAIECHVCLSYMEGDVLTLKTPCQITFQVQMMLSRITGLPMTQVRIIKTPTGGSFGGKSQPVLEPLCGYLAYDLKKPVLMTMDRAQSIVSSRRRNSVRGRIRLAVSEEGKILGRDLDVVTDTGAYFSNGAAVSMAMLKKSVRLYKMESQRYRARAVITNTPVGGAARGYGSPQIHALTEINIENAARALKLDPLDFRLANIVSGSDLDPMGGPALGNVQIEACLRQGAARFGWKEKYLKAPDNGRYRTGVGMAAIVHGNGYFGGYPEFTAIQLTLMPDGTILVNSALHDLGCGTLTVASQIIAEAIGVGLEKVRVLEADTLRSPYDPAGTQACRVTFVCGEAARQGAEQLKEKIIHRASELLELPMVTLQLKGSIITDLSGLPLMDLPTLASKCHRSFGETLCVNFDYQASANPGSYGANFVEVEVDTWTGFVQVKQIVAAHDIGKAINPEFVKGQIYGGIQMNLGYALCEEIVVNEDGRVKNKSFSKYHLINAPSMPPVEIVLIEAGEPGGPYGAKSIGESSSVATAPAVINAINHALGTRLSVLPATPERIIEALSDN